MNPKQGPLPSREVAFSPLVFVGESLADLILLGIEEEYALFVNTNFTIPDTEIQGKFIMLIAIDSIDKMIEAIKKQLG